MLPLGSRNACNLFIEPNWTKNGNFQTQIIIIQLPYFRAVIIYLFKFKRLFLELDPWFAPLLRHFAERANHDQLIHDSRLLTDDASARLYENDDEELIIPGLEPIEVDATRHRDAPSIDIFRLDGDEMAGEPRQHAVRIAA